MRERGEMARGMAAGAERDTSGRMVKPLAEPQKTLSDLGISKTQSSRWQALANVPADQFEAALGRVGGNGSNQHSKVDNVNNATQAKGGNSAVVFNVGITNI